jgi:hypothetical protein
MQEWTHPHRIGRAEGRNHLRRQGVQIPDDAAIITIGPATVLQLNIFAHKAVLALYFEHFRKPLPIDGSVCAFWRGKEDFSPNGVPKEIIEMLPRYGTLVQRSWNESETFEYRYDANEEKGIFGCITKLRRGLFTIGFAISNSNELEDDVAEWVHPASPIALLDLPRYQRKN